MISKFQRIRQSNSFIYQQFFCFAKHTRLDPYLVLDVSKQADWAAIKKQYLKLARIYHPDLTKNDEVNI